MTIQKLLRHLPTAAALALTIANPPVAPAQGTDPVVYNYNTFLPTVEPGVSSPEIGNDIYSFVGFDPADDQPARWQNVLDSGWIWGSDSPARGKDIEGLGGILWTPPALEGNPTFNGILTSLVADGEVMTVTTVATVAADGSIPGQSFRGNPRLLSMNGVLLSPDVMGALILDPDNSLSVYQLSDGTQASDQTYTNLSGGPAGSLGAANTPLSSALFETYFIGHGLDFMGFLTGDNFMEYYRLDTGEFLTSVDFTGVTTGPLADATLADLVAGNVPGTRYLGMYDTGLLIMTGLVPEPSSLLLAVTAAGTLAIRRRRPIARQESLARSI